MLEVRDLTKIYRPPKGFMRVILRSASTQDVVALKGINFAAQPGEVIGIVGPNGAGKSTLIRSIANLVAPTTGEVSIDGQLVGSAISTHRSVGLLLGDERAMYWRLTGRQNLEFFGAMAGLDTDTSRTRAAELLEQAGLANRDRRVFGYSAGMRVQLGIARAMMHEPRLLILDEPSRSLDPVASEQLLERLRTYADGGGTVLLSSHRLEEVEALCDHVLVIVDGEQRYWGTTAAIGDGSQGPSAGLRSLLLEADAGDRP